MVGASRGDPQHSLACALMDGMIVCVQVRGNVQLAVVRRLCSTQRHGSNQL